jgi:hypothetical protein
MDQIRTMRDQEQAPPSLMLRLTCLSVLTLVVIGSMGLLTYIQDASATAKAPVYEFIPGSMSSSSSSPSPSSKLAETEDILVVDHNTIQGEHSPSKSGGTGNSNGNGNSQPIMSSQGGLMLDKEALQALMKEAGVVENRRSPHKVHYNPQWTQHNPFDFEAGEGEMNGPNPVAPLLSSSSSSFSSTDSQTLGYLQMPHLVQNRLVFCSQGDVFMTTVQPQKLQNQQQQQQQQQQIPATKLTTTVGNVLDPRLHPNLRYLAYTATYSGRRDIYLLDLQGGSPAVRLTYWDASMGVSGLIGWWGESALVFRAHSNQVSLPDFRLYVLHLEDQDDDGSLAAPTTTKAANHTNNDRRIRQLEEDQEELKVETETTTETTTTTTKKAPPPSSNNNKKNTRAVSMLQIDPIPLSQARDAARYGDCWYFVRYSQSSHTIRYVGGTAEQLYRYCDEASHADRLLFHDQYNGTSKAPQIYPDSNYLFFLSDRGLDLGGGLGGGESGKWKPDRMNVWALALSDNLQDHTRQSLIQITDTSCDFEGRVIQEYSIDIKTGHMVLRIGADLYWMTADAIQAKLLRSSPNNTRRIRKQRRLEDEPGIIEQEWNLTRNGDAAAAAVDVVDDNNATLSDDDDEIIDMDSLLGNETLSNDTAANNETVNKVYYHYEEPALESRFAEDTTDHVTGSSVELTRLPIVVHSDFHTHQERLIPVDLLDHMTSADIYETAFGSLHFVMTLRGQLWVAPVEDDDSTSLYQGSGRNMPGRRYRVAPGATMGGAVRILAVRHVPNPVEDDSSDRRLAVILATDPLTETAEQAFYLIETQSSATPLFLDMDNLPKPFLGGQISGGSVKEGGIGSVEPDSIKISPCGRRMAWTDRNGRILVMNLLHYQDMTNQEVAKVVVLPQENEIGEPMVGEEVEFSFSPGGRYLAVQHNARNQFSVISIVDLGDAQGEDRVADIMLGRIVQATPDRFNSIGACWGKSTTDMYTHDRDTAMASLLGTDPPEDVATTLYFLSDRDISSDVRSPWGTRQPMPHFKKQKSLFALPLYPKNATTQSEGPFSGGGASELKVDAILARRQFNSIQFNSISMINS